MSTLAIVQARLSSTRLPRKALMEIAGVPMLAHVLERVAAMRLPDVVVLALPTGDDDHELFSWAGRQRTLRVGVSRPPRVAPDDVLGRFAYVAELYPEADAIVRITGDCPLLAPELADLVVSVYRARSEEYVTNVTAGYVDGTDVEVFSRDALLWAHERARQASDREHVTPWIRRYLAAHVVQPERDYSWLKISVDTREDLARVRSIAEELPPNDFSFHTMALIAERCIRAA
jgi:spore coat polysaccharide biosynthesis protein SpsF (cytidylyltransferase family)